MTHRTSVLLVDDELEILDELAEMLELEGYRCFCAETVAKAMALLEQHPEIALTITDLKMPDESGLRLIQRLRASKDRSTMPIIVASGHADMDDVVAALRLQVYDFLRKPIYYEHLIGRLNTLFSHQSAVMPCAVKK